MPTIYKKGPYRFFFFAGDKDEPRHVHVERDDKTAKFWLEPIRIHSSGGFNRVEINKIQGIIEEQYVRLMEAWDDYFGS